MASFNGKTKELIISENFVIFVSFLVIICKVNEL